MLYTELHEDTTGQTEDYIYSLGYMKVHRATTGYTKDYNYNSVTITVFAMSSTEGLTAFGLTYMRIDNLQTA